MNGYDREEMILEEMLSAGEISQSEYNKEMRDLQRAYLDEAETSARDAYENELNR